MFCRGRARTPAQPPLPCAMLELSPELLGVTVTLLPASEGRWSGSDSDSNSVGGISVSPSPNLLGKGLGSEEARALLRY